MPVAALKAALKDHVCCTACGCDALFHWKKGGALCSHCSNEYLHLISVTKEKKNLDIYIYLLNLLYNQLTSSEWTSSMMMYTCILL